MGYCSRRISVGEILSVCWTKQLKLIRITLDSADEH
jgi:hypothetical protein